MNIKNLLITENLKNWYFVDSALLNGHAKKVITDNKDYDEYVSLKAALLSNLNEFYKYVDYRPSIKIPDSVKSLQENAVADARKTKSVAARMIQSESFKAHMKKIIVKEFKTNSDKKHINTISENVIRQRFLKICLDNILIGIPIIKSKKQDRVSDFKSQMLEQAYILIRSDLIRIAEKYNRTPSKKT